MISDGTLDGMNHLPKLIHPTSPPKPADHTIHFSPIYAEVAQLEKSEVFSRMKTSPEGLREEEAVERLADVGPNVVAANSHRHRGWPWRLLTATRNPLVILLSLFISQAKRQLQPAFPASTHRRECAPSVPNPAVGRIGSSTTRTRTRVHQANSRTSSG